MCPWRNRGDVKQFRDMLDNVSAAPAFVARVQHLMSHIEAAVLALKDSQRRAYEDLLANEKLLTRDLTAFAERMAQWDRPGVMQPVPAGTSGGGMWSPTHAMFGACGIPVLPSIP